MFIGIIIFGINATEEPQFGPAAELNWSFAMVIIGMIFTIGAGVLAIMQMKGSSVACFK